MINCDKEAIKTLVVLHGQRKAARMAGLSENTVKSWALRYHWNKLTKPSPDPVHPICTQSPAAIVADELSRNKKRSTLALSRYSAEAAEEAAESGGDLRLAHNVRDVAAVHKTLWPAENQNQNILQLDVLLNPPLIGRPAQVIDTETLPDTVSDQEEEEKRRATQSGSLPTPDATNATNATIARPANARVTAEDPSRSAYRERCMYWRRDGRPS